MKPVIEKANQKILAYGNEVLKESKGVRPLYPIIKAIEVSLKTYKNIRILNLIINNFKNYFCDL